MVGPMKYAIILFLLAASLQAVELPDAPSHTPRTFWASTALYTASVGLDVYSTHDAQQRGCYEVESAWLYGKHPSTAEFALGSAASLVAVTLMARRMARSKRAFWRGAGFALVGIETGDRLAAGIGNFGLRCR